MANDGEPEGSDEHSDEPDQRVVRAGNGQSIPGREDEDGQKQKPDDRRPVPTMPSR